MRYRLRYCPVRAISRPVTVEIDASSAREVIRTIREAEGWIYITGLEEVPAPKKTSQTRLALTA